MRDRILLGPAYGNGTDIAPLLAGFVSNPMEHAEASKISLHGIAELRKILPCPVLALTATATVEVVDDVMVCPPRLSRPQVFTAAGLFGSSTRFPF